MEENMMKRTIAMLLVLIMALSMLPVTAGAAEIGTMDIPRTYASQFNEVESNNTRATANTFNPNSQYVYGVVGDYYSIDDDYDWFKFSVSSNYHMKLEALAADAGDMKFCLYDSAGSLLKTSSFVMTDPILEIDEHTMEYTLAPGTYYIRVNESAPLWRCDYLFNVILTPMLNTPTVSLSNRASDGKVKISWNSVSYASSYKVLRSTSKNGSYTTLTTTTGTSYYDTSAVAGTTYYYKVQAISGNSSYLNSNYSNIPSRTCDLPRPTNVTDSRSASTGKVTVSWSKVSGASQYSVYYSTDGSNFTLLKTLSGTSLTHSSATLGQTYYYKVKAHYSGNSAADSALSAYTKGTATCAAPTITVSNVASTGKIKISWDAVSGAKSYQVYRSTDGGSTYTLLKTVTGTSLTNTSTTAGVTYHYKVRAVGSAANSNSSFSAVKSRTCDLAAPTLTVTTNSNGKPKLTWTKVTGATEYKVYYSTNGGSSWTLLKTMTGTLLTHASASKGVTYSYKVMAVASVSAANSAYSSVKSVTSK